MYLAMSSVISSAQTTSISISLLEARGVAALSLFDILSHNLTQHPDLSFNSMVVQPGLSYFPTTSIVFTAGFAYLAINALLHERAAISLLNLGSNGLKIKGYLAAAVLNFATALSTMVWMTPNNFALIQMNEKKGGTRSEKSAQEGQYSAVQRNADDSDQWQRRSKSVHRSQWATIEGSTRMDSGRK
jgi:hypothetical protein